MEDTTLKEKIFDIKQWWALKVSLCLYLLWIGYYSVNTMIHGLDYGMLFFSFAGVNLIVVILNFAIVALIWKKGFWYEHAFEKKYSVMNGVE